jgi:multiple sugar transport system permease protein
MKLSTKAKSALYVLTALVLLVWIFPIYWSLVTSLKTSGEIGSSVPTLLPSQFTLQHYRTLLGGEYFTFLKNSLVVAMGVVLVSLLLGSSSAYALSRLRFPGSRLFGGLILLVYLFPGITLVVPLFKMMAATGLYNNLLAVILVHILFTLPFVTWTLREFFDAIPGDLSDAAQVDGAGQIQVLRHIYLPLVAPGLAVTAIFSFVVSWNDYIFPSILLSDPRLNTIPVGIAAQTSQYNIEWGSITAASILTIVPAFVFFSLLGRLFIRGLTAGAIKG